LAVDYTKKAKNNANYGTAVNEENAAQNPDEKRANNGRVSVSGNVQGQT
jgi:hypothetical protein